MNLRMPVPVCVAMILMLAACSSSPADDESAADVTTAQTTVVTDVTTPQATIESDTDPQPPVTTATTVTVTGEVGAARPAPNGDINPDDNPAWLGRGEMNETKIELPWSTGQVEAEVVIHRFLVDDVPDPVNVELTDATKIAAQVDSSVVDTNLEPGARYLYIMEATLADGTTYRRFTEAHAVTDTTPPPPVGDLTLVDSGESIELRWGPSSDNYQFARYAIRRSINSEQSVYYGTGWSIDQTTFIDDQLPTAGTVTYEVYAVDFHGNVSTARTASASR